MTRCPVLRLWIWLGGCSRWIMRPGSRVYFSLECYRFIHIIWRCMLMGTWRSIAFRLLSRVWIYAIIYRIADSWDIFHRMCCIPTTSHHVSIGLQGIPNIHMDMRIVADNILGWRYQNNRQHEKRRTPIQPTIIIHPHQEPICDRRHRLYHDGNNHHLSTSSQRLNTFLLTNIITQLDVHLSNQYLSK